MSALSKYLGWGRTKVYYWLGRCPDIEVVEKAGFRMVRQDQLPKVLLRLKQAEQEALARRAKRE